MRDHHHHTRHPSRLTQPVTRSCSRPLEEARCSPRIRCRLPAACGPAASRFLPPLGNPLAIRRAYLIEEARQCEGTSSNAGRGAGGSRSSWAATPRGPGGTSSAPCGSSRGWSWRSARAATCFAPLTFGELLDRWLDVKRRTVEPSTLASYEWIARTYERPALGARRVASLRPMDLDTLYADLHGRGLSPRTVRICHTVMRQSP